MSKSMETNTAAIYLRKSTEDDGKSVGQQERKLRNKAEELGINIAAVYREDDGTSASSVTNDHRPEFERCLADFKAGEFDTIMVWDMDRWTRKGATEAGQLLDLLSKHNGRLIDMTLRERWATWTREPFTSTSPSHISVWEKTA